MYFNTKNYLKNNYNHIIKHIFIITINNSQLKLKRFTIIERVFLFKKYF